MLLATALVALLPAAAPAGGRDKDEPRRSWEVFAEKVYDPEGGLIENGLVTVRDGKIAAVRSGARAPGDDGLKAYAITPGLVDASVRIAGGEASVEQSSEVTPGIRVADALDPFALAWKRQARCGVTTALACPPDLNVIGGLGVVVKTSGPDDAGARTLKADAVLRGAIGSQPSARNHPAFGRPTDFYSRRPTTRMGVEWEWRSAMYAAAAAAAGQGKPAQLEGQEQLQAVLRGELPLMIQTWATQDIRTAVFLAEECAREGLGTPRLILDAAAEAWLEPQLLVRSGAAVVLPPFPDDGRTGDNAFMAWNVAKILHDQGVTIALSAHGGAGERQLGLQAGYAMRGGLPFEAALAAVTLTPARLLGVDDRVGSLHVGKDADLVLWSGEPFQPSARVVGVLLDGALVVDPRAKNDD